MEWSAIFLSATFVTSSLDGSFSKDFDIHLPPRVVGGSSLTFTKNAALRDPAHECRFPFLF